MKRKRIATIFYALALLLSLCACSDKGADKSPSGTSVNKTNPDNRQSGQVETNALDSTQGLTMLANEDFPHCSTENGYYYIPDETIKLKNGSYGTHILYMDYDSRQEVYLCSNTGCSHDDESCPAVLCNDEFAGVSSKIFVWKQKLYLLSKEYDAEGSIVYNLEPEQSVQAESKPAALYQMNLDGTGRKKIYTFSNDVTLEDSVLTSDDWIYFVTKKLETNVDKNASVTTATDRNLVRFNPLSGSLETVVSMNFHDKINWQIMDCYDNNLVLEGISYADSNSGSSDMSQKEWKALYNKSKSVFATLELGNKKLKRVYQIQNTRNHGSASKGGVLYISEEGTKNIRKIDLRTGKTTTLATLKSNNIMGMFSDMLICRTWDLTKDYTLYFVNTKNGKVSHCKLTNQYNGWSLEPICEAGDDALVIYDYKADANSDGSYEIYQYKYALITKEDLYSGKNSFRPIQMIGKGQ